MAERRFPTMSLASAWSALVLLACDVGGAALDDTGPEWNAPVGVLDAGEDVPTTFVGEAAYDGLSTVLAAGDVDGDGIDDIAMGASGNVDGGADGAGKAYIVLGPVPEGRYDLAGAEASIVGSADHFGIGRGLAAADLDGHGFSDIVLRSNDAAWVLFGPLQGALTADEADASFTADGVSSVACGDWTGDGVADVAVGIDYYADGAYTNLVTLLQGPVSPGANDLVATADTVITGLSEFGASVANAGDTDGDGTDDLLAPTETGALLFPGPLDDRAVTLAAASVEITGDGGLWVNASAAGDVNHDGYADVVVGDPGDPEAGYEAGKVGVFLGPLGDGDRAVSDASTVLQGEAAQDRLGVAVGTAGDVDDDGRDDLLTSADNNDAAATDAGRVYLLYGPLTSGTFSAGEADASWTGERASEAAGTYLSSAGHADGRAWDGILFSSIYSDEGGIDAGKVYLVFGGPR